MSASAGRFGCGPDENFEVHFDPRVLRAKGWIAGADRGSRLALQRLSRQRGTGAGSRGWPDRASAGHQGDEIRQLVRLLPSPEATNHSTRDVITHLLAGVESTLVAPAQ